MLQRDKNTNAYSRMFLSCHVLRTSTQNTASKYSEHSSKQHSTAQQVLRTQQSTASTLNTAQQVLRTQLSHLASLTKWLSVRLRTTWFWARVQLLSLTLFPEDWPIKEAVDFFKVSEHSLTLRKAEKLKKKSDLSNPW